MHVSKSSPLLNRRAKKCLNWLNLDLQAQKRQATKLKKHIAKTANKSQFRSVPEKLQNFYKKITRNSKNNQRYSRNSISCWPIRCLMVACGALAVISERFQSISVNSFVRLVISIRLKYCNITVECEINWNLQWIASIVNELRLFSKMFHRIPENSPRTQIFINSKKALKPLPLLLALLDVLLDFCRLWWRNWWSLRNWRNWRNGRTMQYLILFLLNMNDLWFWMVAGFLDLESFWFLEILRNFIHQKKI